MAEIKDFDEFIQEVEEEGHSFKIFGKEYQIPAKIPMGSVFLFHKLSKRKSTDVMEDSDILQMFQTFFGAEITDELSLNPRFDVHVMLKLLNWALVKYGIAEDKEESPKGEEAVVTAEAA